MKKALAGIFFAAGLTGAIIVGTTDKATVKALQIGDYRLAVADRACPEEGEPGYNYLLANCSRWKTVGNYCGCLTDSEEPLTGELDPAEIPDAAFRMVGVCEHVNNDGVTEQTVEFAPVGSSPPPGYTCKLIAPRIINWRVSHRASKTQLVQALQAKCCSACPDSCWVTNTEWKQCPYCLLDSTPSCDTYCTGE